MFIISAFILILTFYLTLLISKLFRVNQIKITILFIIRTIICLTFIPISKSNNWDAYGYFNDAFISKTKFYGTGLIHGISRFLQSYLNLDIYSITLIFSFIGVIGCIAFISNIQNLNKNVDRRIKFLTELIIFFPTLNLWTSAISKDAITFACLNLIIFSLLNLKNRIITLLLSSILCSLVRPFAGMVLLVSLSIALTFKVNIPFTYKLLIRISLIGGIILINSVNFAFLRFGNFEISNFIEIIDFYADATAFGKNAIDAESLNFPFKIFTFMFRPLFIDAQGSYPLLMSFENFILLLIFLNPILDKLKKLKFQKLNINPITLFSFTYIPITWIFYSLTMMNLGASNRYKLMIIPILIPIILILSKDQKYLPKKQYQY